MPQVPIWVCVLIAVLAAAVCGAVAFFAGVNHRKREAEAAIGSAIGGRSQADHQQRDQNGCRKEKGSRARGQGRNSPSAQRVRTRDE